MSNRPEDLTDDELRALTDDLGECIDLLDNEGDGAPDELVNRWARTNRELSRRDALAARKAGRYSVTIDVDGDVYEHELKATTEADAQAEAESGIAAMTKLTGQAITITGYNGPISE